VRAMSRLFPILALSVGLLLASPAAGKANRPRSLLNRPAPALSIPDLDNNRIELENYRGKVVLLNFWATWCAPCRLEIPRFVEWQRQYGPRGLQVLGISIDDSDPPVRELVKKLNVNYPVAMGDAKLGIRYGGVLGVPVIFLIDRRGIVRARFDGQPDLVVVDSRVRSLLEMQGSALQPWPSPKSAAR